MRNTETIEKDQQTLDESYIISLSEGAPATNNAIENYYSTSLKTHRKKQFRTDRGILNQKKLSSMKRAGMFEVTKRTILELFRLFKPFTIH